MHTNTGSFGIPRVRALTAGTLSTFAGVMCLAAPAIAVADGPGSSGPPIGDRVRVQSLSAEDVRLRYYAVEDCCTTHLECQDGLWCTGIEWCNCWGVCLAGYAPNCDDGNRCTVDSCVTDTVGRRGIPGTGGTPGTPGDVGTGHCDNRRLGGPGCGCTTAADCNDSNACTTDTCTAGNCSNTAITCNDGNACTTDTCNPATGCVYTPMASCCRVNADCNDSNSCTTDTCNVGTGTCSYSNLPSGTACTDDGSRCTNDRCDAGGVCQHPVIPCNDANVCTTDTCNPATGCVYTPIAGCCRVNADCNDLNPCTTDTCNVGGTCTFTNAPARTACTADANVCTDDWCDGAGACVHPAAPGRSCDDGLWCNGTSTCNAAATCVAGVAPCSDLLACTTDTCNEAGDTCSYPIQVGWCLISGVCYANSTLNPANSCQWCNTATSQTAWSSINVPANDTCRAPGVLPPGGSHTETTQCATADYLDAGPCGRTATARDITYTLSVPGGVGSDYQLYHYRVATTASSAWPPPAHTDPFVYTRSYNGALWPGDLCPDGSVAAESRCNDDCSTGFGGTNYATGCGGLPGLSGVVVVNPGPVGSMTTVDTAIITDGFSTARGMVTTSVARENHNNNACFGTPAYHASPNMFYGPPQPAAPADVRWRGNNTGYGDVAGITPSCGGAGGAGPCGGPFSGSGSNGGSGARCLATYTFNAIAGNSYTISTCGSYGGDPYVVVSGACSCRNDDSCGLGSRCTCVASSTGPVTICASTYSSSWARWSYTITGSCSGPGGSPPTGEATWRISTSATPRIHFYYDELAIAYDGDGATNPFDGVIQLMGPDGSGDNCTDAGNSGCSYYPGRGPASIVLDQAAGTRNYWLALASASGRGQYELRSLLARAQFAGLHEWFNPLRSTFDLTCRRLDFAPIGTTDRGYAVTVSSMPGCSWVVNPGGAPGAIVWEQLTIPWNYDDCSVNYPIGFNFLWGEQFYSRIAVDTNGRIRLTNDPGLCASTCFNYSCADYTANVNEHYLTYQPEIAVFWTDLVMCRRWRGGCGGGMGRLTRQVAPIAPPGGGREITATVISWENNGYYNGSGGDVDIQAILYIDGRFSLLYQSISGSSSWGPSNYGLVGISGTRRTVGTAVNFR